MGKDTISCRGSSKTAATLGGRGWQEALEQLALADGHRPPGEGWVTATEIAAKRGRSVSNTLAWLKRAREAKVVDFTRVWRTYYYPP